jgi:integrase
VRGIYPAMSVLSPISAGKRMKKYSFCPGYLFIRENGEFITPPMINSHFKKVCKDAGIKPDKYVFTRQQKNGLHTIKSNTSKVNTHMLRHTFATMCIEAGVQPVVLQKMLGHKSIKTTLDVYTSVFDKYRNKELDKLDNLINKTMEA